MKRTFLIFLACAALACGSNTESANSSTGQAETAPDGQKIYKTYCITCHGLYGDMGASGAYNLTTSTLSKDERIHVIAQGRAGTAMTPFEGILKPGQIEAVAKYVETLRK
jgi:mono/diheme cytochrome c family protein